MTTKPEQLNYLMLQKDYRDTAFQYNTIYVLNRLYNNSKDESNWILESYLEKRIQFLENFYGYNQEA